MFSTNSHYWGHIFNPPGVPLGVKFILVPVEFLSVFIKPFALIIRLFANMVAGHVMLAVIGSFVVMLGAFFVVPGVIPLVTVVAIYALELLIACLQAYVFATLTCIYLNDAIHMAH